MEFVSLYVKSFLSPCILFEMCALWLMKGQLFTDYLWIVLNQLKNIMTCTRFNSLLFKNFSHTIFASGFFIYCFAFCFPFLAFSQSSASTEIVPEVLASEEVYFDFGKHALRPDDATKLEAIIAKLKDNEYVKIRITAHTDAIGTGDSNQVLSERRGETVKTFLITKGIPDSLMQVGVYGENAPVADNETDNGRQLNRRATVEVVRFAPKKTKTVIKEDVPMGLVEGTVIDKTNGTPIKATVIIRSKTFRDSVLTDSTGYFSKKVPVNTVVGVDVFAPGYFFETQMMKVSPGIKLPSLDFQLPKAAAGEIAQIKDLFFVGNKAVLLKKSEPILPKVLIFMQINDTIKIEIGGHVNYPYRHTAYKNKAGENEQNLSNNRAKLVYDYLIEHGISKDRLSWKGYSNTKMKFPYATREVQMAKNRRVEIMVLE